jgi:nickel-dependent lactate racemase
VIIKFPYAWAKPVRLDGRKVYGPYRPSDVKSGRRGPTLAEALAKPIGTAALRTLAGSLPPGRKRVLILADDITRSTPVKTLLPPVLRELAAGGTSDKDISILIGNGLHRKMTKAEINAHFGAGTSRRIRIFNHDAGAGPGLRRIGRSPDGTAITVNRKVLESDFVLSIGQIAPHRVAGFSGGSKMVQPGVCGREITASVHWRGWQMETRRIFGRRDNPVRAEMDRIAARAGLKFIVNVVLGHDNRVKGVFAGHPVMAHRKGCAFANSIYRVKIKRADIVIVDSYPCDIDLWQAAKAATPAEVAVKPGGSVIFVTPCPEKVSKAHPDLVRGGYRPYARIRREVRQGKLKDVIQASHMTAFGRIMDKARIVLVSPGFSRIETERLGFCYGPDVKSALDVELRRLGSRASIAVIQQGGKLFPVAEN